MSESLAELRAAGLFRRPRVLDGPQTATSQIDGRPVVNLSSNNYLGLAAHYSEPRSAHEHRRKAHQEGTEPKADSVPGEQASGEMNRSGATAQTKLAGRERQ